MTQCRMAVSVMSLGLNDTQHNDKTGRFAVCHYAECYYAECYYAECHYAECHYAKCHGAENTLGRRRIIKDIIKFQLGLQQTRRPDDNFDPFNDRDNFCEYVSCQVDYYSHKLYYISILLLLYYILVTILWYSHGQKCCNIGKFGITT